MKYFITFAAGNQDYINAGNRIINQVKNTKLFDQHIFYLNSDSLGKYSELQLKFYLQSKSKS